jgi:hypothetical protein
VKYVSRQGAKFAKLQSNYLKFSLRSLLAPSREIKKTPETGV